MSKKQFSLQAYWDHLAENWKPELSFEGGDYQDWEDWHKRAYPKLLELLGAFPKPVDPAAEVEYRIERDGIICERVILDTEVFMSVPCIVQCPIDMPRDQSGAAILCAHGHGDFGKDAVAGLRKDEPAVRKSIQDANYNYGEQMARAGYMTIAPDLRAFGERMDGPDPFPGRDPCNVNYLKGSMMGIYPLTLNIWDFICCFEYLAARSEIDPSRIGMMGLSQGGTMTTFVTAVEKRIKCADIIGYVNPWAGFGVNRANFCGSQIVPNIYRYFDTFDIAGLIAPRPLLLEMGEKDDCFFPDDLLEGYKGVGRIYEAAGAPDCLHTDIHPGGHAFSGKAAFDFFEKYL